MTHARPTMSADAFGRLRELIRQQCGLSWHPELKEIAERRLGARVEALKLTGFEAYHRYLQAEEGELETALELLLTRETYFFREPRQLEVFSTQVLPMLRERNAEESTLRCWSAGCSTGEESYTLALLLREDEAFADWNVAVHGTDLSRRALAQAERGDYGASALRATSEERRTRHFDKGAEGRLTVKGELRAKVSFSHLNLLDAAKVAQLSAMDCIFCRNVLIYFDAEPRQQVLRTLFAQLRPGGFLFLGASENLLSTESEFQWVELDGELCYRRPLTQRAATTV